MNPIRARFLAPSLLIVCFMAVALSGARAEEESPLDVWVNATFKVATEGPKNGAVVQVVRQVHTVGFPVSLKNKRIDPLADISLRLYAVGAQYIPPVFSVSPALMLQGPGISECAVVQVFARDHLAVAVNETAQVDMGTVSFRETREPSPSVVYSGIIESGALYEGLVLDVWIGGKPANQVIKGGSGVKLAYDAFLQRGPSPAADPAGPSLPSGPPPPPPANP